ncbi:MAG: flavodoxin-dependent (E)-4-hydroxy-3-methylbut-2-enyl-diphosphate synthase [Mucispirillum sp.]|uniref:4-hydroxy-3-methylbut-2-en-1-yl diphosphate synthase (flavodoxin) n=1 Tax=Candidatus Mucispirillum faecigallinarum TaxID=2838699 RepID=A0A9D2GVB6_9BACT|nr:flavodoxin-dependent (E)-4-hydroxy-3-methylbut-2-enyl-diphosphate synthase [Mucispirillum sp.]HIZ89911.1 flavodoxin-dependent (E)-4-hydroxy-3-methylbut-2-enyl-diphosphate synthase [Candidatus Mucispirillum faecigallinarum]
MKSRVIKVGSALIGGGNPVLIQSMTNTDTRDVEATVNQILELERAGCEIIRCAVPDENAAYALKHIKDKIHIPLIADIHFDYKLAVKSVESGADCIRINPGNLGGFERLKIVTDAVKSAGAAIRVGINSGSLEKDILEKQGVTASSIVESALRNIRYLYDLNFDNFKVSLKSSSVPMTIKAYQLFANQDNSPLHVGVTEAGTLFSGTIKSAVGIGAVLASGIGDTLRVSLTGEPLDEIKTGWQIVSALDLRRKGPEIISCPTCGRTAINLIDLANKVEDMLQVSKSIVTVAVMGCAVNGPGEAREADYGIAGGKGQGLIFKKGSIVKKVDEDTLLEEFAKILKEDGII